MGQTGQSGQFSSQMDERVERLRQRVPSTWDEQVERLRQRLPAAPEALLDGYVRFAPWIAIVFGVLGLLGVLTLLGIGAAVSPAYMASGYGAVYGGGLIIALVLGLAGSALDLVGGYYMLRRSLAGWWLVAAALVVSVVSSLLNVALLSLIIALLIAWIHVLVKPRYS
jgi:hypothetical protein